MGTWKISALRKFTSVRIITPIKFGRLSEVRWRVGDGWRREVMGCTGSRDIDRFPLQSGRAGNYTGSISPIFFGLGHEGKTKVIYVASTRVR